LSEWKKLKDFHAIQVIVDGVTATLTGPVPTVTDICNLSSDGWTEVQRLIACGVLVHSRSEPKARVFEIRQEKPDGGWKLRLIYDGRPLNAAMSDPTSVVLEDTPDVVSLSAEHAWYRLCMASFAVGARATVRGIERNARESIRQHNEIAVARLTQPKRHSASRHGPERVDGQPFVGTVSQPALTVAITKECEPAVREVSRERPIE